MKGTLEGCILLIIGRETTYGYEIMERLIQYGFCGIREGTIYPLLVRLEKKNLTYRTVGTGDVVTSQVPAANAAVPGGSTVILYLGDAAPEETTTVPNVVGMSYEGAKKALEAQGLFMQAAGSSTFYSESSKAQSQSVAAGESVATGTIVEVQFSSLVEDGVADFYEIT